VSSKAAESEEFMNKEQLTELLFKGSWYEPSESAGTMEDKIYNMSDADIKEAVLEYIHKRPKLESDCEKKTMRYSVGSYCRLRGLKGVCKVKGINGGKYDLSVMGNRNGKMYDDGGCAAHLWGIVEENLRDYNPDEEGITAEEIQKRIVKVANNQAEWKHETIDKAINALTESTHRMRDEACKTLLKQLQNMPLVQPWDINSDDRLPF
jgi:flagellin-specific chaperone FliS